MNSNNYAEEKRDVRETIEMYWNEFQAYTDKLSTVCRQLAFAEGGIFWIFFQKNAPGFIVLGFFFLILYFVFDVLQYYFGRNECLEFAEKAQEKYETNKNISFRDIKKPKNPHKKIRKLLEIKLIFIAIASGILFLIFIKEFLCNPLIHINK